MSLAAILLLDGTRVAGQQATPAVSDEYRVKAAFVYRFAQFVDWPAEALAKSQTLDLCVLRPNPFGTDLDQLAKGETINGRLLRIRDVAGPDELAGCHALFAGTRAQALQNVLKAATGLPILTVGESDRFLDEGGIISLRIVDRRVRFEVNAANARRAGLRISAQLLDLAIAVHGGPL